MCFCVPMSHAWVDTKWLLCHRGHHCALWHVDARSFSKVVVQPCTKIPAAPYLSCQDFLDFLIFLYFCYQKKPLLIYSMKCLLIHFCYFRLVDLFLGVLKCIDLLILKCIYLFSLKGRLACVRAHTYTGVGGETCHLSFIDLHPSWL